MHRPDFDALAIGEKVYLDPGGRNQPSCGRNPQKLTAMCAAKREPVNHLFPFADDVLNLNPHVGEAF